MAAAWEWAAAAASAAAACRKVVTTVRDPAQAVVARVGWALEDPAWVAAAAEVVEVEVRTRMRHGKVTGITARQVRVLGQAIAV